MTRTISNSVKSGRTAHAYLFSGSRGTGKTTTAKILAKAVNCDEGPSAEPCNECSNCLSITNGTSLDVVEMDAASNRGIDEIRNLKEKVYLSPAQGRNKVFIIDEVHMLTTEACNALLKILEEPPANTLFILATTEPHKILPTILSRCQRYDFRRIPLESMLQRLKQIAGAEAVPISDAALVMVARTAAGGMRDAIGLLDQLSLYAEDGNIDVGQVTSMLGRIDFSTIAGLAARLIDGDAGGALRAVSALVDSGQDMNQVAKELAEHFRLVMVAPYFESPGELEATEEEFVVYREEAQRLGEAGAIRCSEAFEEALNAMRRHSNPRLPLELAIMAAAGRDAAELGPADKPAAVLKPTETTTTAAPQRKPDDPATAAKAEEKPVAVPASEPAPAAKPETRPAEDAASLAGKQPPAVQAPPAAATPSAAGKESSAPQAPAAASTRTAPVTGDDEAGWSATLAALGRMGRVGIMTQALLREFHFRGVDDGTVVLWVPPAYRGHHASQMENEIHADTLKKALAEAFGRPVAFTIVLTDEAEGKSPAAKQRNEAEAEVEKVRQAFDAEVLVSPFEKNGQEEA